MEQDGIPRLLPCPLALRGSGQDKARNPAIHRITARLDPVETMDVGV